MRPDLNNFDPQTDDEITDKYTEGPDKLAENVHLQHPNRNTNKKRDRTVQRDKQQQDEPKHGRTEHLEQQAPTPGSDDMARVEAVAGNTAPEDDAIAAGAQITGTLHTIPVMDKTTFAELASHPADVCVTIYLTTHGSGMEINEQNDKKALKDALREARSSMEDLKIEGVIDDILRPAEQLLRDDDFWHHQTRGLALFLAPDTHSCCLLPYDPGSVVHVHTSFILMPLVPLLMEGESYFLLTLSKHAAQLYQGYKFEMVKIDIPEMPRGIDDVVHYEEKRGGVLRRGDGSTGGSNLHGLGADKTGDKAMLIQYFQEVNRTLKAQILGSANLPLLLAGVDYLLPLYREVNTYPHLIAEELHGNFEHMAQNQLFELAQKKMDPYFALERRKAFQNKADHGGAPVTTFLQDVIRAAYEGRIAQLYVAKGQLLWGHYTAKPEEPVLHRDEEPGDDCLTNQAVVQTILHGGEAFVVDREKMPADGEMAAVLRYS